MYSFLLKGVSKRGLVFDSTCFVTCFLDPTSCAFRHFLDATTSKIFHILLIRDRTQNGEINSPTCSHQNLYHSCIRVVQNVQRISLEFGDIS